MRRDTHAKSHTLRQQDTSASPSWSPTRRTSSSERCAKLIRAGQARDRANTALGKTALGGLEIGLALTSMASVAAFLFDFFTDREHGSKNAPVPAHWRHLKTFWSVYAWSSFAYSVTGVVYLLLLRRHPEKALYASEILIEPALWIWQGVISFVCDFVDLGRLSWSHPADRFCACVFISSQVVKFFYFLRACSWPCLLLFPPALGGSLWIFGRSCLACTRRDAASYFFWHSAWHFALPSAGLLFYVLRFTVG